MSIETISETELTELVKTMPASPRLLAEVAPKLQQAVVPLADVTVLLRQDAGLAVRLIAIANSAVYARAEPVTSLEDAVACIGYSEVHRLIGAIAATELVDEPLQSYAIASGRFRENALFVALVMEELSDETGLEPRTAYTLGLLRSIGKVALDRVARIRQRAIPPLEPGQLLLEWESANWGTSNPEIAARILTAWRFPEEIVAALRDHYRPGPAALALSHLLNIAAGAADLRGYSFRGEEEYWQFTPENFAHTGIDEGRLVWAGERAFRALQRLTSALP